MPSKNRYDVFVSHNRQEKAWVRTFCLMMRQLGLRVFFDEDTIEPGEDIVSAIEHAVEHSRHIILIISSASIASPWVALETAMPICGDPANENRTLIPVMLEKVQFELLRPAVRRLNIVDLSNERNRNERLQYLLRTLGIATEQSNFAKLWDQVNNPETRAELRVASLSDTLSWGWTGDKLLEELIKLDYETIDGLTAGHEGHVAQWAPVFTDHPDTWRLLVKEPQTIVGYWHFVPLFEKEMRLARQGKLLDSNITTDKVRLFELEGYYDIYFVSLCIKAQYRRAFAFSPLLRSLLEIMRDLAHQGVFFRDICANAYTPSGVAVCRSFDMRQICEHHSQGTIFSRRAYPFPPLRMLSEVPELLDLYGSKSWESKQSSIA